MAIIRCHLHEDTQHHIPSRYQEKRYTPASHSSASQETESSCRGTEGQGRRPSLPSVCGTTRKSHRNQDGNQYSNLKRSLDSTCEREGGREKKQKK